MGAEQRVLIHIRIGDFLGQVGRFARACGARLIVVLPREGRAGSRVTALAGASAHPVLVARSFESFRTLVAATDLEDDDYPVLRSAAVLGDQLRADVLAVHNVSPVAAVLPVESAFATALLLTADTVKLRRQRLVRATAALTAKMQHLIANRPDTVSVILEQCQSRVRRWPSLEPGHAPGSIA